MILQLGSRDAYMHGGHSVRKTLNALDRALRTVVCNGCFRQPHMLPFARTSFRGAHSAAKMSFYAELLADTGAYKYYVDGAWTVSSSGSVTGIKSPETAEVAYNVQACTTAEVDAAYEGAWKAQREWAQTPLYKRAEFIHKAAQVLRENPAPIADALVVEIAKPAKDSQTEVVRSADLMDYVAEEGLRYFAQGELLNSDSFTGTQRNKLCMISKVRTIASVK